MPLFTSSREKRLWLWSLAVFATIISTLFIGRPLAKLLSNQNVQAVFFLLGMILVGATIIMHGLRTKPNKVEIATLLGIVAVYTMFFLRLGIPERSHLIEYSVLAIFIHKSLSERANQGCKIPMLPLLSIVITFLIGVFDECIQFVLPNRVFDPMDILFNGFAVILAIGSALVLKWIKLKVSERKKS